MDDTDRHIAGILQVNGRCGADEIAAEIGLSASAVHRRIARMREEGVIAAEVAILDPKAFGVGMTFIVEIVLEKVRAPEVSAIKQRLKAAPEVQQIYNVTGDVDLMLIVLARDVEHFEEISRNLFSADPLVRRYRTSVVMDRVKTGQTIQLF
jgi:Lrp/AsnC family leucine-responsive transcriptional regulator